MVLLLCILLGAYNQHIQANPQAASDSLSIWVDGLCGMCKTRIGKAAKTVRGVETASWDQETHQLSVTFDPNKFKVNKLHYKIASVGHDSSKQVRMAAPFPSWEPIFTGPAPPMAPSLARMDILKSVWRREYTSWWSVMWDIPVTLSTFMSQLK